MTEVKKTKTPRSLEAITKGALALPLSDRVKLKNLLAESVDQEVKDLKEKAANAEQIAKA